MLLFFRDIHFLITFDMTDNEAAMKIHVTILDSKFIFSDNTFCP